jgi:hypothetical protein
MPLSGEARLRSARRVVRVLAGPPILTATGTSHCMPLSGEARLRSARRVVRVLAGPPISRAVTDPNRSSCGVGVAPNASRRTLRPGHHARRCRRCPVIPAAETSIRHASPASRQQEPATIRGPVWSSRPSPVKQEICGEPGANAIFRRIPHACIMAAIVALIRDVFHIFWPGQAEARFRDAPCGSEVVNEYVPR